MAAKTNVETKYKAKAHTSCEFLWSRSLLQEMGMVVHSPLTMYYDNQAAIHIASNPVFHERTKHIEVDCHFIQDLVMRKQVVTPYIKSEDPLGYLFTKALERSQLMYLCHKLGMTDLYAPT